MIESVSKCLLILKMYSYRDTEGQCWFQELVKEHRWLFLKHQRRLPSCHADLHILISIMSLTTLSDVYVYSRFTDKGIRMQRRLKMSRVTQKVTKNVWVQRTDGLILSIHPSIHWCICVHVCIGPYFTVSLCKSRKYKTDLVFTLVNFGQITGQAQQKWKSASESHPLFKIKEKKGWRE